MDLHKKNLLIAQGLYVFLLCVSFVIIYFSMSRMANAERSSSAIATVRALVKRSIQIIRERDLDFGESFPGDPESVTAPGSDQSAQFRVTGEPNKLYSISLPPSVRLVTGSGNSPQTQILISKFQSNPVLSGRLDALGTQLLSVGAARAPLLLNQVAGQYAGTFSVTVTYY